jgi:hypothetical protein
LRDMANYCPAIGKKVKYYKFEKLN